MKIYIYIHIHIYMIISYLIILGMRNVSDLSCRENQNTHFMLNFFLWFENNAVYELLWRNIVEPDRPHLTV